MKKHLKIGCLLLIAVSLIFSFASCSQATSETPATPIQDEKVSHSYVSYIAAGNPLADRVGSKLNPFIPEVGAYTGERWIPLDANGSKTIEGLKGQGVFLVRVNKGNKKVQPSKAGSIKITSVKNADGEEVLENQRQAVPQDNKRIIDLSKKTPNTMNQKIEEWNKTELPKLIHNARSATNEEEQKRIYCDDEVLTVGTSKGKFWINPDDKWERATFTLRADSDHCKIWVDDRVFTDAPSVSDDNDQGLITQGKIDTLKTLFDKVYVVETGILGYEFGGGPVIEGKNPYGQVSGGCDGDTDIQIVLFDMKNDKDEPGYGTFGYFWGKDCVLAPGDGMESNYCEAFYIDSFNCAYKNLISTLAHEFQHMIHFNRKLIIQDFDNKATWFNEMMSLMTEDIMAHTEDMTISNNTYTVGSFEGFTPATIDSAHPMRFSMEEYLSDFNGLGLTTWNGGSSYETVYALGSYLARKVGTSSETSKALSTLMTHQSYAEEAVMNLLSEDSSIKDFGDLAECLAKAMFFNKSIDTVPSSNGFDKYVVTTPGTGADKDLYAYDPWLMKNSLLQGLKSDALREYYAGPLISDLQAYVMEPYSFSIHSSSDCMAQGYYIQDNSGTMPTLMTGHGLKAEAEAALINAQKTNPSATLEVANTGLGDSYNSYSVTVDVTLPADSNVKMYLAVR